MLYIYKCGHTKNIEGGIFGTEYLSSNCEDCTQSLDERKKEIIEYLDKGSIIHAKAALDRLIDDLGYQSVPMVGFKVPKDRKRLIDKEKVTKPDGTIDYKLLFEELDKLGKRLLKEQKILQNLP